MALDFPNSPTNGQVYADAGTGEQWVYDAPTNSWTSKGLVNTSGGLAFKGSLDITAAPPTGLSPGWQYANSTTGTPNAGFTGLTGTIAKGDVVLYTGPSGWILQSHTVPDATAVVKGIVQLADAAAVTAGTAGRVVDAAQLKPALTFTHTGVGATTRAVTSKLQDTRSTSDYATVQEAVDATPAGGTLRVTTNPCSFDGVTIRKPIRVVGLGREQGVVTGTIKVINSGYGCCFEDISFESPSGSEIFTVTGRGGIDIKHCRLLPGTPKHSFSWDATEGGSTYTPVAIELIGAYHQSGRLFHIIGSAAKLFPFHAKEGCQIRFTGESALEITNTSATAEFLQYEGQLDIAPGIATLGDEPRLSLVLRNVSIDDGSNLCLTQSLLKTDIADCSIKVNSVPRHSIAPSVYKGPALSAVESMMRPAAAAGTVALRPDLYGQDLFFITGDATLTGNVVYSFGGPPSYDGQKVEVVFTGTTTLGAFTFNIFGQVIVRHQDTVDPFTATAYGYQGNWYTRLSGVRSALALRATGTHFAIPDTTGAAIAVLEAELNKVKAALRETAVIAP